MNKKVFSLLSVLLVSFMLYTNVYALNIVEAGETIVQEGDYDSTRLVAGNRVTNKANINGLSFIAGNEINLEGNSEYGFYAGNILIINESITKDAFIAGNSITIDRNAILGRDVYVAGNNITIKANITRDLRAGGTSVDLRGITIGGDAYIDASEVILDKDTVITGKLQYVENTHVEGLEVATIGSKEIVKAKEIVIENTFKDIFINFLESTIAALIVMLVLFYLIPKTKEKLDKVEISFGNVCKTALIGLGLLIVVPILVIIALFTGVLTPLSLIFGAVYGISLYLASLVVYYLGGKYIATKVFKNESVYLTLICGIVIFKLLEFIPYLGGLITIITFLYGFGLIFKFIKARNN